MSATFITWGIPAIALALAGLACVWAWWRSRRFTKEYPDRAIADSYTWNPNLPLPTAEELADDNGSDEFIAASSPAEGADQRRREAAARLRVSLAFRAVRKKQEQAIIAHIEKHHAEYEKNRGKGQAFDTPEELKAYLDTLPTSKPKRGKS